MIIDSHVHICEPPHNQDRLQKVIWDGTLVQWAGTRADASIENLLSTMEENNVDRAVVMGLDGIVSNNYLGQVVKKHSDKLMGFVWVKDPKDPNSVNELEKAVNIFGLRGLKLHPSLHGFVPSEKKIFPLLKKSAELKIPVLIHCYPWPPGYFYHNLPRHIDELKKQVPDVTIIIGHMGHVNFQDLIMITPHQGIFAETSWGLTLMAELHGLEFTTKFVRRIGVDNLVYGSDWFGPNGEMERQLNFIEKMSLTNEEKDKILGGNLKGILGIK